MDGWNKVVELEWKGGLLNDQPTNEKQANFYSTVSTFKNDLHIKLK